MPELPGVVFLSYASQDAEAATRIGDALRAAGIDVWFDQSKLRGGDSWDAQIKKHIHDCAIFMPLISERTNARTEGYFRREWKLATRRLLDRADDTVFLVPVVIDETRESGARVPEEFLQAQWTWLPGGETPPAFAQRVRQLLDADFAAAPHAPAASTRPPEASARSKPSGRPSFWVGGRGGRNAWGVGLGLIALLVVLGGGAFWYFQSAGKAPALTAARPAKFSPPPHSVAVLAFTNMSGDAKDEYFSDGLSEELLNTLVRVKDLQVAARTSSFSFKGTSTDIPTVGRKLNVGAVLEGSVRKAGDRVRITTQLINTVTGYHLWSQTFDRDVKDILALQAEIATKVASALQAVLLVDDQKLLTVGGTADPAAFDAYLRARQEGHEYNETTLEATIALYDEAIERDPNFALAHAYRAQALFSLALLNQDFSHEATALASAEKAVALAPTAGSAYTILGSVLSVFANDGNDLAKAEAVLKRGLTVEPGNFDLLSEYADLASLLQRPDAIAIARQAVALNPLKPYTYFTLGRVLASFRQFDEALGAMNTAVAMSDSDFGFVVRRGLLELEAGRPRAAVTDCETDDADLNGVICLAIAYHQTGRIPEATAMLNRLVAAGGDAMAYQYAEIYTQWGQKETAIKWLETALRLRDPGLTGIKADSLLDPIRDAPQFKQIVQQLNFPT